MCSLAFVNNHYDDSCERLFNAGAAVAFGCKHDIMQIKKSQCGSVHQGQFLWNNHFSSGFQDSLWSCSIISIKFQIDIFATSPDPFFMWWHRQCLSTFVLNVCCRQAVEDAHSGIRGFLKPRRCFGSDGRPRSLVGSVRMRLRRPYVIYCTSKHALTHNSVDNGPLNNKCAV